jgi:hypothetical protein
MLYLQTLYTLWKCTYLKKILLTLMQSYRYITLCPLLATKCQIEISALKNTWKWIVRVQTIYTYFYLSPFIFAIVKKFSVESTYRLQ